MGLFKNIITFGASGRIERKIEEFDDLKDRYQNLYNEMEQSRVQVNQLLQRLITVKVKAVKSLERISTISKNIKGKERDFIYRNIGQEYEAVDFDRISGTVTAGQMAISATKGVSAGVGTALGAWALVSTVGTASTGTAIAGLSGVAATNATLAWFGGGSIIAGGGGIAAGTAVIGGIIAIPAIALMGVFNHLQANKQINQIESEMRKILSNIDQMEANILNLELIEYRADELIPSIEKARQVFEHELKRTHRELNKFPIISKWIRLFRSKCLKRNYYSVADLESIAYIGGIATKFATLIDTPVFEEE